MICGRTHFGTVINVKIYYPTSSVLEPFGACHIRQLMNHSLTVISMATGDSTQSPEKSFRGVYYWSN